MAALLRHKRTTIITSGTAMTSTVNKRQETIRKFFDICTQDNSRSFGKLFMVRECANKIDRNKY